METPTAEFSGTVKAAQTGIRAWIERRPGWLQPPLLGVFLVYGFAMLRGGFVVLPIVFLVYVFGSVSTRATLGPILLAVLVYAPGAGFLGGLLVSALRPVLRRLGAVGRYLQFIIGTWAYCVVLVFAIAPAVEQESKIALSDPFYWAISAIMGITFGIGGAHAWYGDQKDAPTSRSSPRGAA